MNRRGIVRILSTALLGLVLLSGIAAQAETLQQVAHPEELGFDVTRLERVTKTFQGYVDTGELPGAVVLIARHDKVAYLRAFGYQDRDAKTAMAPDSIFRIASMTKPIVTAGAMMLVEEGKLNIAAPVFQYLPEFKDVQVVAEKRDDSTGNTQLVLEPQKRPMTVQDLMRHTAGLVYAPPIGAGPIPEAYRDADVANRDETLAQMVTKLSKLPLAHQPGEVWEYGMAIDVLGRVIEVVSGKDLDQFLEERITGPLGMESTGFYVREADRNRLAQPDKDPVTGQRPPLFDPTTKPKRLSGGGGLVSTAGDYLSFCEMLLHGGARGTTQLLAPSSVSLMTSNALKPGIGYGANISRFIDLAPTPAMGQGFGLGLAVRTEAGQNPLPGSVGSFYWTGAFGTTFYIDPSKQMIIVMMIQVPLPKSPSFRQIVRSLVYQALMPAE
jgi:CubicO group peptidase (beta-lactamase class C family)